MSLSVTYRLFACSPVALPFELRLESSEGGAVGRWEWGGAGATTFSGLSRAEGKSPWPAGREHTASGETCAPQQLHVIADRRQFVRSSKETRLIDGQLHQ